MGVERQKGPRYWCSGALLVALLPGCLDEGQAASVEFVMYELKPFASATISMDPRTLLSTVSEGAPMEPSWIEGARARLPVLDGGALLLPVPDGAVLPLAGNDDRGTPCVSDTSLPDAGLPLPPLLDGGLPTSVVTLGPVNLALLTLSDRRLAAESASRGVPVQSVSLEYVEITEQNGRCLDFVDSLQLMIESAAPSPPAGAEHPTLIAQLTNPGARSRATLGVHPAVNLLPYVLGGYRIIVSGRIRPFRNNRVLGGRSLTRAVFAGLTVSN